MNNEKFQRLSKLSRDNKTEIAVIDGKLNVLLAINAGAFVLTLLISAF
jgi:hypothetical protein